MSRGKGDFIASTDFEDVICLFNGRRSVADEILAEPAVRSGISERFARYVKDPDLEDAVLGFVQTEPDPNGRLEAILSAFRRLADAAKSISRVDVHARANPSPVTANALT